jgi:hypothetical protein
MILEFGIAACPGMPLDLSLGLGHTKLTFLPHRYLAAWVYRIYLT